MTYKAEYEDNEIEILTASSNDEAIAYALSLESDHGILFNVTLQDDGYNDLETIF